MCDVIGDELLLYESLEDNSPEEFGDIYGREAGCRSEGAVGQVRVGAKSTFALYRKEERGDVKQGNSCSGHY